MDLYFFPTTAGAATGIALVAAVLFARWRLRLAGAVGYGLDLLFLLPLALWPDLLNELFFDLLLLFNVSPHFLEVSSNWAHIGIVALVWSVMPFPILYIAARIAFSRVASDRIDAARTLGMGGWGIFWRVMIPSGWPWLAGGFVLGFVRAFAGILNGLWIQGVTAILCFVLLMQLPKRSERA